MPGSFLGRVAETAGHHGVGYFYLFADMAGLVGDRLKFGSPLWLYDFLFFFILVHCFMITFELDGPKLRLVEKVCLLATYVTLPRSCWLLLASEFYKADGGATPLVRWMVRQTI